MSRLTRRTIQLAETWLCSREEAESKDILKGMEIRKLVIVARVGLLGFFIAVFYLVLFDKKKDLFFTLLPKVTKSIR